MDPTANLAEQREILEALEDGFGAADLERLAELCKAMDEWISEGGALPEQWDPDY